MAKCYDTDLDNTSIVSNTSEWSHSINRHAHACSSFGENTVTANQPPTCNLAEITRSTLSVSPATVGLNGT